MKHINFIIVLLISVLLLDCQYDSNRKIKLASYTTGGLMREKVATIQASSLVLWGRQDGILDGAEFAKKVRRNYGRLHHASRHVSFSRCVLLSEWQFVETLPNAQLRWIEECGHVPHLEKPDETADAIAEFLQSEFGQPTTFDLGDKTMFVVGGLAGAGAIAAVASNFL